MVDFLMILFGGLSGTIVTEEICWYVDRKREKGLGHLIEQEEIVDECICEDDELINNHLANIGAKRASSLSAFEAPKEKDHNATFVPPPYSGKAVLVINLWLERC